MILYLRTRPSRRRTLVVWLGVALLLTSLIVVAWSSMPTDEAAAEMRMERSSQSHLGPLMAESAQPGNKRLDGQNAPARAVEAQKALTADMLHGYNTMKSGRKFAVAAWSRPREGGRFYASVAARFCSGYRMAHGTGARRDSAQPDGRSERIERENAKHLLQERCAEFTDQELLQDFQLPTGNDLGDALAGAVNAFVIASRTGPEERRKSLGKLLDLADPLAIDDLGMRLAVHRNASLGTYIYFDGGRFPVRADPPIARAFSLLACGMGLECGSNDPSLLLLCANGGKCHEDRFDRLAAEVEGGVDGKAYAEVILWYQRMLSAIKNKNAAAFVDDQ